MRLKTVTLSTWDHIRHHLRHGWLYRGQRCADWQLETSLERCCQRMDVPPRRRRATEVMLFREFRRVYHDYCATVPSQTSVFEWMALMQHHGTPTRLLDFSYSIYVAAYFALESATGDSAIWAIEGPWATDRTVRRMRLAGKRNAQILHRRFVEGSEERAEGLFFKPPYVLAASPINPFRLNKRLRIQQGVFVAPGDVSKPFMSNLEAIASPRTSKIVKIVIPASERRLALRSLFDMGISSASLFPDLDGYARSLGTYHPVVFDPINWQPPAARSPRGRRGRASGLTRR